MSTRLTHSPHQPPPPSASPWSLRHRPAISPLGKTYRPTGQSPACKVCQPRVRLLSVDQAVLDLGQCACLIDCGHLGCTGGQS